MTIGINGMLVKLNAKDEYALMNSLDVYGADQTVATAADLTELANKTWLLKEGMSCYVSGTKKLYRYENNAFAEVATKSITSFVQFATLQNLLDSTTGYAEATFVKITSTNTTYIFKNTVAVGVKPVMADIEQLSVTKASDITVLDVGDINNVANVQEAFAKVDALIKKRGVMIVDDILLPTSSNQDATTPANASKQFMVYKSANAALDTTAKLVNPDATVAAITNETAAIVYVKNNKWTVKLGEPTLLSTIVLNKRNDHLNYYKGNYLFDHLNKNKADEISIDPISQIKATNVQNALESLAANKGVLRADQTAFTTVVDPALAANEGKTFIFGKGRYTDSKGDEQTIDEFIKIKNKPANLETQVGLVGGMYIAVMSVKAGKWVLEQVTEDVINSLVYAKDVNQLRTYLVDNKTHLVRVDPVSPKRMTDLYDFDSDLSGKTGLRDVIYHPNQNRFDTHFTYANNAIPYVYEMWTQENVAAYLQGNAHTWVKKPNRGQIDIDCTGDKYTDFFLASNKTSSKILYGDEEDWQFWIQCRVTTGGNQEQAYVFEFFGTKKDGTAYSEKVFRRISGIDRIWQAVEVTVPIELRGGRLNKVRIQNAAKMSQVGKSKDMSIMAFNMYEPIFDRVKTSKRLGDLGDVNHEYFYSASGDDIIAYNESEREWENRFLPPTSAWRYGTRLDTKTKYDLRVSDGGNNTISFDAAHRYAITKLPTDGSNTFTLSLFNDKNAVAMPNNIDSLFFGLLAKMPLAADQDVAVQVRVKGFYPDGIRDLITSWKTVTLHNLKSAKETWAGFDIYHEFPSAKGARIANIEFKYATGETNASNFIIHAFSVYMPELEDTHNLLVDSGDNVVTMIEANSNPTPESMLKHSYRSGSWTSENLNAFSSIPTASLPVQPVYNGVSFEAQINASTTAKVKLGHTIVNTGEWETSIEAGQKFTVVGYLYDTAGVGVTITASGLTVQNTQIYDTGVGKWKKIIADVTAGVANTTAHIGYQLVNTSVSSKVVFLSQLFAVDGHFLTGQLTPRVGEVAHAAEDTEITIFSPVHKFVKPDQLGTVTRLITDSMTKSINDNVVTHSRLTGMYDPANWTLTTPSGGGVWSLSKGEDIENPQIFQGLTWDATVNAGGSLNAMSMAYTHKVKARGHWTNELTTGQSITVVAYYYTTDFDKIDIQINGFGHTKVGSLVNSTLTDHGWHKVEQQFTVGAANDRARFSLLLTNNNNLNPANVEVSQMFVVNGHYDTNDVKPLVGQHLLPATNKEVTDRTPCYKFVTPEQIPNISSDTGYFKERVSVTANTTIGNASGQTTIASILEKTIVNAGTSDITLTLANGWADGNTFRVMNPKATSITLVPPSGKPFVGDGINVFGQLSLTEDELAVITYEDGKFYAASTKKATILNNQGLVNETGGTYWTGNRNADIRVTSSDINDWRSGSRDLTKLLDGVNNNNTSKPFFTADFSDTTYSFLTFEFLKGAPSIQGFKLYTSDPFGAAVTVTVKGSMNGIDWFVIQDDCDFSGNAANWVNFGLNERPSRFLSFTLKTGKLTSAPYIRQIELKGYEPLQNIVTSDNLPNFVPNKWAVNNTGWSATETFFEDRFLKFTKRSNNRLAVEVKETANCSWIGVIKSETKEIMTVIGNDAGGGTSNNKTLYRGWYQSISANTRTDIRFPTTALTTTSSTDFNFFSNDYDDYARLDFIIDGKANYTIQFNNDICTIERFVKAELPSSIRVQ